MNPYERDYVKHRLARSAEALNEAEFLLKGGFSSGVINRLYYACFYAVSALLFSEGYSSSKHSGIKSLFDRLWIKPKRLPSEMSKFYRDLFDNRQMGDYEETPSFDQADLATWLNDAKAFVDAISAWLRDNTDLYTD